jgi:hypothetical protein
LPLPAVGQVGKPYADLIVAGESPVGALVASGFPFASVTTSEWQCAYAEGGLGQTA